MVPVWVWLSLHPVPSIWLRGNLANRWPSRPWNRQSPLIPLQPTVIPDNPGLIPNCVRGIAAGASYWEPGQVTADSVGSLRTLPSNGTTARGQWRQRVHPIRLFINKDFGASLLINAVNRTFEASSERTTFTPPAVLEGLPLPRFYPLGRNGIKNENFIMF